MPLILQKGSTPIPKAGSSSTKSGSAAWTRGIRIEFIAEMAGPAKMSQAGSCRCGTRGIIGHRDGGVSLETGDEEHREHDERSRFSLPEFDKLFEQSRLLPDSPERPRYTEDVGARSPMRRWLASSVRERSGIWCSVQAPRVHVESGGSWTSMSHFACGKRCRSAAFGSRRQLINAFRPSARA
jgi:hypothetical protein